MHDAKSWRKKRLDSLTRSPYKKLDFQVKIILAINELLWTQ